MFEKINNYINKLFHFHTWKETAHEGPFTQYKCSKCNKNKIQSLI